MNPPRLQKLMEFLKEEPDNPFLIYGVAMEYENSDLTIALKYYEQLLEEHPDYLPTYFQVAHIYWEEEQIEKANHAFKTGIALAERMGNKKILQELKSAYHNFSMEFGY